MRAVPILYLYVSNSRKIRSPTQLKNISDPHFYLCSPIDPVINPYMTLGELYRQLRDALAEQGLDVPEREARLVIQYACAIPPADFISRPDMPLGDDQVAAATAMAQRRGTGEPLSRILGWREFYGLRFDLAPDTLDPRPDTEILVEGAIKWLLDHQVPGARILDLGTGTGCIPISILKNIPQATGVAIDLAPGAVAMAQINARTNGVADRLRVVQSDWTQGLASDEVFDLITSNPPYIPTHEMANLEDSVRNHDPILALDGGNDGYDPYRHLFIAIQQHLSPDGLALFEIGAGQLSDLRRIAIKCGLDVTLTLMDYGGIPRVMGVCMPRSKNNFESGA